MKDIILFPFDIEDDNLGNYIQAIELAKEQNATLVLFTALPEESYQEKIDEVYFYLLKLNGFYQTRLNNWQPQNDLEKQRLIVSGDYQVQLEKTIQTLQPKYILN